MVQVAAALGLARSPNTPLEVLAQLAKDPRDIVQAAIARNPKAPTALVVELLASDHYQVWTVALRVLAAHEPAPKELILARWHQALPREREAFLREGDLPSWLQGEISQ